MSDEVDRKTSFEEAGEEKQVSLLREFMEMLQENKKYWMLPMILVFLLLGLGVLMTSNPAVAPFIYSLF